MYSIIRVLSHYSEKYLIVFKDQIKACLFASDEWLVVAHPTKSYERKFKGSTCFFKVLKL